MATILVGFDSAWADRATKPGAICALRTEAGAGVFHPPRAMGFDGALAFVAGLHRPGDTTLVAIDQPTIVRTITQARPVERAVASLMSWSGGGIQPAFRGGAKASLFGDGAPIWRFLEALAFADDPEAAASATAGGFVMEIFPALALLSLDPAFVASGKSGPRYNPARPTFQQDAWRAVRLAAEREARRLDLPEAAAWCAALDADTRPRKGTQDELDALLCLLIAARWRRERASCAMIGDLASGYIVAPVSPPVRARLADAAAPRGVALA